MAQKYGVPALLSFFIPGLGQLIKGQILKAILIWIGMFVFSVLIFIGIIFLVIMVGLPLLVVGSIGIFVLWLWQIYDAYNS